MAGLPANEKCFNDTEYVSRRIFLKSRKIVRGEFQEVPGLQLTKPQAQRLWGLDALTCDMLLDALVASRFLRRTQTGRYARVLVMPESWSTDEKRPSLRMCE